MMIVVVVVMMMTMMLALGATQSFFLVVVGHYPRSRFGVTLLERRGRRGAGSLTTSSTGAERIGILNVEMSIRAVHF